MAVSAFPSLSPSGRRLVAGEHVLVVDGDTEIGPGTGGKWADETTVFYTRQPDGAFMRWRDGVGSAVVRPAGFKNYSVRGVDHWAGYRVGVGVVFSNGAVAAHLSDPAVSEDRSVWAARIIDGGGLHSEPHVDSPYAARDCFEITFDGDAMAWTTFVGGIRTVVGRRSRSAPVERLSIDPTRHEGRPVLVHDASGQLWLLTLDNDRLLLRPWGSTRGRQWSAPTNEPDIKRMASGQFRLVWDAGSNQLVDITVDPATATNDLRSGTPPPPPTEPPNVAIQDVPNYSGQLRDIAAGNPRAFANAHGDYENQGRPGFLSVAEAEEFIRFAAYELNRIDSGIGLNGKRATSTLSQDALCYRHADGRESVIDVINGAGGSNPSIGWNVVGHYRPAGDGQRWIRPEPVGSQPPVTPPPPPVTPPSSAFTFPAGVEMPEDVALSIVDGYLEGIRERDKVRAQDVVPSRGALMYLFAVFFRELSSWIVERKRAPIGVEWWQVRDRIVAAAVKHYQDRQGVD